MNKTINKFNFGWSLILIFSLSLFITSACKDNATEADKEIILPPSDLTYNEHIRELFMRRCASRAGCHSQIDRAANLDLTLYQSIISHPPIEGIPLVNILGDSLGDGANSFLYKILLSDLEGRTRMPKDEQPLPANNIVGIRTWIDEGAPESP
jgi:hypothetical protein